MYLGAVEFCKAGKLGVKGGATGKLVVREMREHRDAVTASNNNLC